MVQVFLTTILPLYKSSITSKQNKSGNIGVSKIYWNYFNKLYLIETDYGQKKKLLYIVRNC